MKTVMRFDVTVVILMLIGMPAMAQTPDALPSEDGSAVDVAQAATQSIDADLESKTANKEAMAEQVADENVKQLEWVDTNHQEFRGWLQKTAHRMDGWFGDTNPNEPARASLRVMMDTTWNEYDGTTVKPRVRGKIKLPTLENRLSIVFGDDSLDDIPSDGGVMSDDRVATPNAEDRRFDRRQAREDNSSLALRWSKFRRAAGIDVDLGVRSDDVFVRAKYDKSWQLSHDIHARFEQMYRYGSSSEHTALTTLEFVQPQSESRQIVSRSHLYYAHKDQEDLDWSSSLFQQHALPVKHGTAELSYGIYTGGDIVDKNPNLNTYGPYVSYRQPVWRDWLFLQGDVSYYNNKTEDRDHHVALFSRVEVVF